MTKKIPQANIVKGQKRVLPAGHPLLAFYSPDEVIIEGSVSDYSIVGKSFPAGSNLLTSLGQEETASQSLVGNKEDPKGIELEEKDVPDLSDITILTNTTYFNETNVQKAKIILKVKNKSKNKENVKGVDARIYYPERTN